MLTEDEVDSLTELFYNEAPYDFIISFLDIKPPRKGSCFYGEKVVEIYRPKDYRRALQTVLHEIAHARVSEGHTPRWDKELVRLFVKYDVAPKLVDQVIIGPELRRYIDNYSGI